MATFPRFQHFFQVVEGEFSALQHQSRLGHQVTLLNEIGLLADDDTDSPPQNHRIPAFLNTLWLPAQTELQNHQGTTHQTLNLAASVECIRRRLGMLSTATSSDAAFECLEMILSHCDSIAHDLRVRIVS